MFMIDYHKNLIAIVEERFDHEQTDRDIFLILNNQTYYKS